MDNTCSSHSFQVARSPERSWHLGPCQSARLKTVGKRPKAPFRQFLKIPSSWDQAAAVGGPRSTAAGHSALARARPARFKENWGAASLSPGPVAGGPQESAIPGAGSCYLEGPPMWAHPAWSTTLPDLGLCRAGVPAPGCRRYRDERLTGCKSSVSLVSG